ncbi:hypothetical protein EIG75_07170 [Pseudomonas syringae]|uniref:Uncharacterized protein n=1 Tax=Pseudomonas syringae TaxID=317 RepID=A0A6B2AVH2_PSESX|nr:hypothetical protein [Pseudomonas syringae]NAO43139.1 hypothetical protein [Pseudomonas syringae]NAO47517.1 hypothetical protein [Pseudomonas syringae]NAO61742.1 hypothetical protein [Pseudomonas syringae]NAO67737.1 hypothetical protein [Pseudomonas syringae]
MGGSGVQLVQRDLGTDAERPEMWSMGTIGVLTSSSRSSRSSVGMPFVTLCVTWRFFLCQVD